MHSQIEDNTSIRIEKEGDQSIENSGLLTKPSKPDFPSTLYTPPKALSEYAKRKKEFDMTGENGLLTHKFEKKPKWFGKDKPLDENSKGDQYIGDYKSNGKFVSLVYRDHQEVDGDVVRIFVNEDIIRGNAYLTGNFQQIKINLVKGFNKIDILAINEGQASPNTAEFHLYDELGNVLVANEWNLAEGNKATMIVIKK